MLSSWINFIIKSFWYASFPFYILAVSPYLIVRVYEYLRFKHWNNIDETWYNSWLMKWWDKIESVGN